MRVLIVHGQAGLAGIWASHLKRGGARVDCVSAQEDAVRHLSEHPVDVVLLSLTLTEGSALAIADYASYRRPDTQVIFVNNSQFFSDGSIFNHVSNARAMMPEDTPPEDLTAMVEHYATHSSLPSGARARGLRRRVDALGHGVPSSRSRD